MSESTTVKFNHPFGDVLRTSALRTRHGSFIAIVIVEGIVSSHLLHNLGWPKLFTS